MAVTFGSASAPSQKTVNLDALFSLSLADYGKTLVDNIGTANPFFNRMLNAGFYRSGSGTHIETPLMYALANLDSYDGYDELPATPIDGISNAIYQWRQLAAPIMYSMKEVKQNKHKLIDLVQSKIKQTELGVQEGWATQFFQGSGAGALATAKTSAVNGSSGIDPLPLLVHKSPTDALSIGNIAQNTYSWWQNKYDESAASTGTGFLEEFDKLYIDAALGTGGPPDLIIVDPTTYHLIVFAIYMKYRQTSSDMNFPFENTRFKRATIVADEKVPDVYSDVANYTTYGTAYLLNTAFFEVRYEEDSNFVMLKDENGKTFAKPLRGDSRLGHVGWMGNTTVSNRRKQAVWFKLARTLTWS